MHTNFKHFHPTSKTIIFPGDRELILQEQDFIEKEMTKFLSQWKSHGKELYASCKVLNKIFIVIVIDETFEQASGCSKDSLSHKIKELGEKLNIDFFNNGNIIYLEEEKLKIIKFHNIKEAVKSKILTNNTKIFTFVDTLKDLEDKWLIQADQSWLNKYFKNKELA